MVSRVEVPKNCHLSKEEILQINFLVGKNSVTPLLIGEVPYSKKHQAGIGFTIEMVYEEPEEYTEDEDGNVQSWGQVSLQMQGHEILPCPQRYSFNYSTDPYDHLTETHMKESDIKEMIIRAVVDHIIKERDKRTVDLMRNVALLEGRVKQKVSSTTVDAIQRAVIKAESAIFMTERRCPAMGLLVSSQMRTEIAMSPLFSPDASMPRIGSVYLCGQLDQRPVYVVAGFPENQLLMFPIPSDMKKLIEDKAQILTCSLAYFSPDPNYDWVGISDYKIIDSAFYSIIEIEPADEKRNLFERLFAWIKGKL